MADDDTFSDDARPVRGEMTINGITRVSAIEYVKRGDAIDLTFRSGRDVVAEATDLGDVGDTAMLIGGANFARINRGPETGTLQGETLSAYTATLPGEAIHARAGTGPQGGAERNGVEVDPAAPREASPESDAAERARRQAILDRLAEQYDERDGAYRARGGAREVVMRETGDGRIVSASNDPSAARAAVELADARGRESIRVTGHSDFRREAWIEASARGIEATGYVAQDRDREEARRRAAERIVAERNVVTPGAPGAHQDATAEQERGAARGTIERAATIYAAAKTTTVAAAARLAEHLRAGIDAREQTQTLPTGRSRTNQPEQEVPTP